MFMHTFKFLGSVALVAMVVLGCGDDDSSSSSSSGGGGACNSLCTDAKFTGGTESKFQQNVTECQCAGTGGNVAKTACEAYCAPLGIAAAKSFLSGTDKCVCDGTSK